MTSDITRKTNGANVQFEQDLAGLVAHIQQAETAPEVPLSQREHTLLLDSVDHFASDWIAELKHARVLNEELERMVQQRAAIVRNELTKLFLLGAATASHARRGAELKMKLKEELEKLGDTT